MHTFFLQLQEYLERYVITWYTRNCVDCHLKIDDFHVGYPLNKQRVSFVIYIRRRRSLSSYEYTPTVVVIIIIMSVPLVMGCRHSYDGTQNNNVVVCRHSTGSYASSTHTRGTDGMVDVPSLSRVSIDTVSSLGDVFHDAGRLSRRSLVGRDYENTSVTHGVMMDVYHSSETVCNPPGMMDVAYSNVAAILAMDGASVRSYPWVAGLSSRSDHIVGGERSSDDEMKSPTTKGGVGGMDGVLTRSSVAMLQNALETALSLSGDSNACTNESLRNVYKQKEL